MFERSNFCMLLKAIRRPTQGRNQGKGANVPLHHGDLCSPKFTLQAASPHEELGLGCVIIQQHNCSSKSQHQYNCDMYTVQRFRWVMERGRSQVNHNSSPIVLSFHSSSIVVYIRLLFSNVDLQDIWVTNPVSIPKAGLHPNWNESRKFISSMKP